MSFQLLGPRHAALSAADQRSGCSTPQAWRSHGPATPWPRPARSSLLLTPPSTLLCPSTASSHLQRPTRASRSTRSTPRASAAPAPLYAPNSHFWRTYLSQKSNLSQAIDECADNILGAGNNHGSGASTGSKPGTHASATSSSQQQQQQQQQPDPDLAIVFVSEAYEADYPRLVELLRRRVPTLRHVFGCTGYGVIGVDGEGPREAEGGAAFSLTLAHLPQAELVVRHVDDDNLPDGDAPPGRWADLLGVPAFPEAPLSLLVASSPGWAALGDLLAGLDFAFPEAQKIGGLSSAISLASTATFAWSAGKEEGVSGAAGGGEGAGPAGGAADRDGVGGAYRQGAAVLAIHGEVQMDLMIAQGCRPLTDTVWTIEATAESGDLSRVAALAAEGVAGGRPLPALEAFQRELQSALRDASEGAIRRTVSNLVVGLAPRAGPGALGGQAPEPQDVLIRPLMGFDADQCLVIGEAARPGQRLRFMVRDREGAQQDLRQHGLAYKRRQLQAMLDGGASAPAPPFGMLMFTCNGRGSGLHGEDSYDARTMSDFVPVPCAGFQCNGEIGRVGGTTHLHGFTCAVGVLRPTAEAAARMAGTAVVGAAPHPELRAHERQEGLGGERASSGGSSEGRGAADGGAGAGQQKQDGQQ